MLFARVWRACVGRVLLSLLVGRKTALMLELCKLLRDELSIGAVSPHPLHCPTVNAWPPEHCCGCLRGAQQQFANDPGTKPQRQISVVTDSTGTPKIDQLGLVFVLTPPRASPYRSLFAHGQYIVGRCQVTNDIFTREDAEFLTKNSALEEGR